MATDDYEYRYEFTRKPMGEFSNYSDKAKVYKDILSQIKKYVAYNVATDIRRAALLRTARQEIKRIFNGSPLLSWTQESFQKYERIIADYHFNHFANDDDTLLAETSNLYSLKRSMKIIYTGTEIDAHTIYCHTNRTYLH